MNQIKMQCRLEFDGITIPSEKDYYLFEKTKNGYTNYQCIYFRKIPYELPSTVKFIINQVNNSNELIDTWNIDKFKKDSSIVCHRGYIQFTNYPIIDNYIDDDDSDCLSCKL